MARRIAWSILFAALAAIAAGQVLIVLQLREIDRRIETMDVPADVVAAEIEDLRKRLATLERKVARNDRAEKTKAKSKSITE